MIFQIYNNWIIFLQKKDLAKGVVQVVLINLLTTIYRN